jgi:hypothetical protein
VRSTTMQCKLSGPVRTPTPPSSSGVTADPVAWLSDSARAKPDLIEEPVYDYNSVGCPNMKGFGRKCCRLSGRFAGGAYSYANPSWPTDQVCYRPFRTRETS